MLRDTARLTAALAMFVSANSAGASDVLPEPLMKAVAMKPGEMVFVDQTSILPVGGKLQYSTMQVFEPPRTMLGASAPVSMLISVWSADCKKKIVQTTALVGAGEDDKKVLEDFRASAPRPVLETEEAHFSFACTGKLSDRFAAIPASKGFLAKAAAKRFLQRDQAQNSTPER